jgi:FkbM family methyltransferase
MLYRITKAIIILVTLFLVAAAGLLIALPHCPALGLGWVWLRASGPKQCDFQELARSAAYRQRFQTVGQRILSSSRLIERDGDRQLWDIAGACQFWLSAPYDVKGKLDPKQASNFAEQVADQYYHPAVHMQAGDIVLDVGADHGDVTWKALQAGAQKVIAIEIDPAKWECLNRTFAREVKDGRVVVVPSGVWDKEGTVELGGDSVVLDNHVPKKVVGVKTIDQIVGELNLPRVDFITMDIEGAEKPALRGAAQTLRRFHPRMAIASEHLPDDTTAIPETVRTIVPSYEVICGQCNLRENRHLVANVLWFHVQ